MSFFRKNFFYFCALGLIFVADAFFALSAEAARRRGGRTSCSSCPGCGGLNTSGLKPNMARLARAATQARTRPISCYRPQACQDAMRICFERCGQRGRAARRSAHTTGRACDWNKRDTSKVQGVKRQLGLSGVVRSLSHGREGGGLHEQEGSHGIRRQRYQSRQGRYNQLFGGSCKRRDREGVCLD